MEFDRFAREYEATLDRSLAFSGEGSAWFARRKASQLAGLAQGPTRILDVGCGSGLVLAALDPGLFPAPEGTDTSPAMIERTRRELPQARLSLCPEGGPLPYPAGAFDLTFTSCTLHHVPPARRAAFARELARVTRPGGRVVVFEHNPWNPVTRAVVAGCEFDRDAVLLSGPATRRLLRGAGLQVDPPAYYLFFPPSLGWLTPLERGLARLPLGGQYRVVGRVAGPPAGGGAGRAGAGAP